MFNYTVLVYNKNKYKKLRYIMENKIKLANTYSQLPGALYTKQAPSPVREPNVFIYNHALAEELGIKDALNDKDILSGNKLIEDSVPIAQSYAGHQYGHFNILGDGRAVLLGELETPDKQLIDVQLKGSGPTPYSRRGDGRATLSSMLREYLISEAMEALGIKTTRSLAVVSTGEKIMREKSHDGAILTRLSDGHIRVGTFQFAAIKDTETIKALADYSIQRFYPELKSDNPYLDFLDKIIDTQAELIAKWQSIGFIHGVMNTDNTSIAGETIDYGPCAFMNTYHPETVFSSIDHQGRYAYKNQPMIAQWNLARLAETLLPLLHEDTKEAIKIAENHIISFMPRYNNYFLNLMRKKIGLLDKQNDDVHLINDLLMIMKDEKLDFTNTFTALLTPDYRSGIDTFDKWIVKWHKRLSHEPHTFKASVEMMKSVNPFIIPRNHQVEKALKEATLGNMDDFNQLLEALREPYVQSLDKVKYTLPPDGSDSNYKTYCGT